MNDGEIIQVQPPIGWVAGEAEGALANGTVVEKINAKEGDTHADGDRGKVVASHAIPPDLKERFPNIEFFYFVAWDDLPAIPIGVTSDRVKEVA